MVVPETEEDYDAIAEAMRPVPDLVIEANGHTFYADLEKNTKAALEEANAKKAEYEEKLAAVEQEIEEQRKAANSEIAAMKREQNEAAKEEARKILEAARENGEKQKMMIISGAREDITHMIEEATRKVMAGETSADPYEDFIRNAERSRANGHK